MTKKSKEDKKTIETKSKSVSKSFKEEVLIQESRTDSDYDGDSLQGSLNSDDFDSDCFDSEDDVTKDRDGESSKDELHDHQGSVDHEDDESEQIDNNNEEDGSDEGSDRNDEVAPRNTVGDVPLEWYKDEKPIGYDIARKKLTKKEKQDKLVSFLAAMDDSKNWRKVHEDYNDEEVALTKEESQFIRRILKGEAPHADFDDPYAPYVDRFKWTDAIHPLSSAPEHKRRFIPSKWEAPHADVDPYMPYVDWFKLDDAILHSQVHQN